jgi:segregation and condensation protein B
MSENENNEEKQGDLPLPASEPPATQKLSENVARLPSADRWEKLRVLEAVLFAAANPMEENELTQYFTGDDDIPALLEELQNLYAGRGVNLMRIAGKWAFRTAPDLSFLLERISVEPRRLSRAALETLAIIAYHQPVTRAEIEEVRGVSTSKGTLDVLLEMGWIRLRGRRRAPGRPVTYGTTETFLEHFGFDSVKDLPGLGELKGAGLLDSNLPPGFNVPEPSDLPLLMPDEEPLEEHDSGEESLPELEAPLAEDDEPAEVDEENSFRPQVFDLLRRRQG